MKKVYLFAVILFITSTGLINAQSSTKSTAARQTNQQARIADGVHSGELTRQEVKRLEREQKCIQIEKRIAKADGTVTRGEKRFLRREQNRAGRHVASQKHDKQNYNF